LTLALFTSGGTISMATSRGSSDAAPRLRGRDFLDMTPGLTEIGHEIDVHDVVPVPSASLQLSTVLDIVGRASELVSGDHAGAILTQGTDTLEEVAYLVDLLWACDEPFVVTGAMRNPTLAGPDGAANLLAAAVVAADPAARGLGVVVAFSDEVHAARWVRKQHSTSLATFGSPNQGPIGHVIESRFTVFNAPRRLPPLACPDPDVAAATRVALYTASFDDDGLLLDGVEESHDGLVVAALGGGHVAASIADRLAAIAQRIPVVLASRTGAGPVLRETYGAVGSEIDLQRRGLLNAGYLDAYKARILLRVLLSTGADREQITAELDRRS